MRKNINKWFRNFYFKKRLIFLLGLILFANIYFLGLPNTILAENISYTLHLKDSYSSFSWKSEDNYKTSYDLKLTFTDTFGNTIEGHDITIEIGPNNLKDDPYGFGYIPISGETTRGADLIEVLNLEEYTLVTGEKYKFDHAEVYTDGAWQTFSKTGDHWHIWCQSASSSTKPTSYGWRGKYNENTNYTITETTEYKLVYKLVRYGQNNSVESLETDSGISFQIFNYSGENTQTGINDNGIYNYFSFRGQNGSTNSNINQTTDADGFGENRAKVLPKLENGYPVFNCQGLCPNASLGYLFGSSKNPNGFTPVGVTGYQPTNTLLQTEIIENVEYYYYDSNRNAVDYDIENNRFMLRDYVERGYKLTTYENEKDRYEFLPFNYLNNENTLTNTTTQVSYQYEDIDIDHWFGMTMEFTFYMPRDGVINEKDMIFSFSGDDDVWVFIDDVLVLDLGGTHGAVDGSINFKTGAIESYLNWNGTVGEKNKTTIYQMFENASSANQVQWNDSNTTFKNYTKHTLKFFYLERGASVSNCKIRFNIPVLPTGTLSVQKQFNGPDRYNEEYEFTLYDTTTNTFASNQEYTIGEEKYTTDELGKFRLKNNEIAIFKLQNEHKYYVEETSSGLYALSYQCSFEGTDCNSPNKTPEFIMDPDATYQAVFINKTKTYQLEISKLVYLDEENIENEQFEFLLQLKYQDGTISNILDNINSNHSYELDEERGTITYKLKNNESIIIEGIPINVVVTLNEINHDGYTTVIKSENTTLANGDTYEFTMDSNKNITVYNIPGITLPETGGTGSKFYHLLGSCFIFTFSLILLHYKTERGWISKKK